ncbi:MAG: hypothetical protein ACJAUP_001274 [Cellvibrionaceae bacterium]
MCNLIKDISEGDKDSVVIFTENEDPWYTNKIANSKGDGHGSWDYYASKSSFFVDNEIVPSCWGEGCPTGRKEVWMFRGIKVYGGDFFKY